MLGEGSSTFIIKYAVSRQLWITSAHELPSAPPAKLSDNRYHARAISKHSHLKHEQYAIMMESDLASIAAEPASAPKLELYGAKLEQALQSGDPTDLKAFIDHGTQVCLRMPDRAEAVALFETRAHRLSPLFRLPPSLIGCGPAPPEPPTAVPVGIQHPSCGFGASGSCRNLVRARMGDGMLLCGGVEGGVLCGVWSAQFIIQGAAAMLACNAHACRHHTCLSRSIQNSPGITTHSPTTVPWSGCCRGR